MDGWGRSGVMGVPFMRGRFEKEDGCGAIGVEKVADGGREELLDSGSGSIGGEGIVRRCPRLDRRGFSCGCEEGN